MNDPAPRRDTRRNRWLQVLLLGLALLTSPALCCGGLQLLDALPSAWLPSSLDFTVNLFESNTRVENETSEMFYLTAISTTYGHPRLLPQNIAFRQRAIPVGPQSSVVLQYDSADLPLSGIVVCRNTRDCRLLPVNPLNVYELKSYESLEPLEPGWWEAIQASPELNYGSLIIAMLTLVPIVLFSGWIFLKWRERKTAG